MQPEKIGRYKIISELGHGGMAIVYLGYDNETEREVAIKVLLPEFGYKDSQLRARFKREAQIIAKFDLPSIVQLYDVGEEKEQPYLVMRYMRGGSLYDKLKEGTYSIEKAAQLLDQIAPAIDEAHANGIVHRDLKPSNILFDSRGNPSISDFGIAKVMKTRPSIVTNPDQGSPGTPSYMAPEQLLGDKVDGRTDIYALGIMLYEMITGSLPPETRLLKNLGLPVSGTIPSILDENPELPEWVDEVISKALARKKEDRYQTAVDMANAIKIHLQENPPEEAETPLKTIRFPLQIVIVSLVLVAAFFISSKMFFPLATSTPVQIHTQLATKAQATNTKLIPTQFNTSIPSELEAATDTPSAPSLPVTGGADKVAFLNNNNIWIMNVDGSDLKSLTNDKTEKFNLQWLPDGRTILFITGKTVKTIDIDTKEESIVTSFGASDYFESFRISPNGKQVAISLARELHVVDFDLDQIKKATTKDDLLAMNGCLHYTSEEVEDIRWSKDGKKLAIKFAASTIKNLEDYIRIIDIQFCKDSRPLTVDEFPGGWFDFFTDDIISFDWNGNNREGGNSLFIMNSDKRNDGFGRLGIYNNATYSFWEIAPIDGICCYRDAVFSPDGSHVLFAFQDIRLGELGSIEFYYQPYASLEANSSFIPLPLPDGFFGKRTDSPSPVLRPAK